MHKRVKGGIEKHYCDNCGKLLFDYIPKNESSVELFGVPVPEYKMKRHAEFRYDHGCKKKGIQRGEYCVECLETLYNQTGGATQ
jgi:hypothetical protein